MVRVDGRQPTGCRCREIIRHSTNRAQRCHEPKAFLTLALAYPAERVEIAR
jgi:hypothetical protein